MPIASSLPLTPGNLFSTPGPCWCFDFGMALLVITAAFFVGSCWGGMEPRPSLLNGCSKIPVLGIFADFLIDVLDWGDAWYKLNVKYPFMERTLARLYYLAREIGLVAVLTKGGRTVIDIAMRLTIKGN